jgi:hypothetical protein
MQITIDFGNEVFYLPGLFGVDLLDRAAGCYEVDSNCQEASVAFRAN